MQSNQKYVTVENIIGRLSTKVKDKIFNKEEIVQWCAECTIEVIGNPLSMHDYNRIKLRVEHGKALLPCNVYRLLDVYNSANIRYTSYYNDGIHLVFSNVQTFEIDENGKEVLYVNYLGIAVDPKTGYPLILRGHELACEAYCTKQLYRSDFYAGKIPHYVWREISDEASTQCAAANNGIRHETNDDMRQMMLQVHNMIPRMKEIPLYHLDGVE